MNPATAELQFWVSPLLKRGTLFTAHKKWFVSMGTCSGLVQAMAFPNHNAGFSILFCNTEILSL